MPPVPPMLAKPAKKVPTGAYLYEPKWDGFRCIVFRDGDEVELGSRNERPLTRYFPELVESLRANLPERCVLDGEIVVAIGDRLEFERLQDRIHPAESRVRMLAEQTPASFVAFDLLAASDESLLATPFRERRERLSALMRPARPPIHLTRATDDHPTAQAWLADFEGAGLDGVVAKRLDDAYHPNARAMTKVKHERTADVVVAGYRWHKSSTPDRPLIGSLLLGLYDEAKTLHFVGVAAAFSTQRRAELVEELSPYVTELAGHAWGAFEDTATTDAGATRRPGGESRWNAGKDLTFTPLRPELVCEVAYEHMQGTRFRHTARFRRWRPDRDPGSVGFDQLEEPAHYDLADVLGGV